MTSVGILTNFGSVPQNGDVPLQLWLQAKATLHPVSQPVEAVEEVDCASGSGGRIVPDDTQAAQKWITPNSASSATVATAETSSDPAQPRRFEKNMNMHS